MTVQRMVRWSGLVMTLLTVAGLAIYIYRIVHFNPDNFDYYADGWNDADQDLRVGKLTIKDAPTDKLKDRIYNGMLDKDYGINREMLADYNVSEQLSLYIGGYNARMVPAIAERLGASTLAEVRQRADAQTERLNDAEQYAVYSAVIENIYANPKAFLVIGRETADRVNNLEPRVRSRVDLKALIEEFNLPPLTPLSASLSQAIEDYAARNATGEEIKQQFDVRSKYVLLYNEEFEAFFHNSTTGWKAFYTKYPHSSGFTTLSRVGFNRDSTEAIIYVERKCGSLCADGRFYILKKESGVWHIKNSIPFYSS